MVYFDNFIEKLIYVFKEFFQIYDKKLQYMSSLYYNIARVRRGSQVGENPYYERPRSKRGHISHARYIYASVLE